MRVGLLRRCGGSLTLVRQGFAARVRPMNGLRQPSLPALDAAMADGERLRQKQNAKRLRFERARGGSFLERLDRGSTS